MQWSPELNAGFSAPDPDNLVRPVVRDGPFGYERLNVADQRRGPDSLLNWTERALRVASSVPKLGWGQWRVIGSRTARCSHTAAIGSTAP